MTLAKYECGPGCRCPLCDETCAAIMTMAQTDLESYARFNQEMTARMLATAPDGGRQAVARHMADYSTGEQSTAYRTTVQAPEAPAPAREITPLAEVQRMVAAKKAEMAAEKEGRLVLRRARNEIARDFEYLRRVPVTNGYSEALARQHGAEPDLDIYQHGPVPEPYSLALGGEIVSRRADGTPVRLPEGDDPPDGYALALEAMRQRNQKDNDD